MLIRCLVDLTQEIHDQQCYVRIFSFCFFVHLADKATRLLGQETFLGGVDCAHGHWSGSYSLYWACAKYALNNSLQKPSLYYIAHVLTGFLSYLAALLKYFTNPMSYSDVPAALLLCTLLFLLLLLPPLPCWVLFHLSSDLVLMAG